MPFSAMLSLLISSQLFPVAAMAEANPQFRTAEGVTSVLETAPARLVRVHSHQAPEVLEPEVLMQREVGKPFKRMVNVNANNVINGGGAKAMLEQRLQAGPSILVGRSRKSRFLSGFGKCALVGSGGSLLNASLGDTIDKYDTVVRVNRLPTPNLVKDLGRKTTILFANHDAVRISSLQIHYTKMEGRGAQPKYICQRGPDSSLPCPFEFLLIRDDAMDPGGSGRSIGNVTSGPADLPKIFTQELLPEVNQAIRLIVSNSPTSGFRAFLTMANVCDSLQTWGFGKAGTTIDGHQEMSNSLAKEHDFMRMVSDGAMESLKQAGWPPSVVELAAKKRGNIKLTEY